MVPGRLVLPRATIHLLFILGFALLIFSGDFFHLFEGQELGLLDLRFRLRGERSGHPDIVIVEIDDESIRRIGHWPWPRSYHATLLKILSNYQTRHILYDVLFTEASTDPSEDELLTYAIEKAGNVIVPFFYHSEQPFLAFFPLPSFREAARVLGYVNIFPDRDGRIRRIRRSIHPQEGPYYHTSVLAVLAGFRDEEESQHWLGKIPADREESFWINYPGPFSRFLRIPFHEIVEKQGEDDSELQRLLKDKIVVVGETATGSGDFRPTPFSSAYPGCGIQASAIHTLLMGKYLHRFGWRVSLGILTVLALLVSFLTWRNPPRLGLVAVSILTTFYLVWNFLIFCFLGWILPVFPVLLVIFVTYVLALFLQYTQIRFEGELFTRELSLAARIQENFLPQEGPKLRGVDMAFQCRFARVVGGDLYDWVLLGDRRLGFCVGDVSGKGIPASLYMARAISEFRALARDFTSPSALLQALNTRLVYATGQGIFVTMLYLILDLDSKTVCLSSAGHEPLLFYRGWTHQAEWIQGGRAQPLGLFLDVRYPEETFSFEGGDFFLLISDGVRELRNPRNEEFGLERTKKALDSFSLESAEHVVQQLFHAMDEFSKGNHAHDDCTVLCVKLGTRF